MNSQNRQFINLVKNYYKKHHRILPWRNTSNPYHIVVSEIMLQQTQVPRVIEKYNEFIKVFPTWKTLAEASFTKILQKWSGLGYNRRAKYIQAIAQKVTNEFDSILPDDQSILETFPGIGKATAASIIVYSFNKPIPFIETNVRRVFIHHFFPDSTNVHDNDIAPLVQETLDKDNPREWYWALMDYGTYLSTIIENPNRKSKHYTKQSKFEGSVRKVRGEILRQLLKHETLNNEQIYKVDSDYKKVETAIEGLIEDKIIKLVKSNYKLV